MHEENLIDPENLPHFQIPKEFLDQLYDFTGGKDGGSGFILSYVDDEGRALIYSRSSTQIIEMGLRKCLETYLAEAEENESSFDINEEESEE